MTSPSPLAPEVVRFLDAEIFSVPQLELLLLVHAAGGRVLSIQDVDGEFYLPAASFSPWLAAFAGRGLLVAGQGGYCALPAGHPSAELLTLVADTYARRRVTVTRHVYAAQDDPARRFADAFRLRKDKP